MQNAKLGGRVVAVVIALAGLAFAPFVAADDEEDVMALVEEYANLEDDLEAQADLIRDDRVMITAVRQSDQEKNMSIQIASRKAGEAASGGKTRFITTIESPQVAIYGDVAVASFMRMFTVIPHNQPADNLTPNWVTLVLVKEDGEWGIAHTHMSPATPGN